MIGDGSSTKLIKNIEKGLSCEYNTCSLAPEWLIVQKDSMSECWDRGCRTGSISYDKVKYVVHYRNLQPYKGHTETTPSMSWPTNPWFVWKGLKSLCCCFYCQKLAEQCRTDKRFTGQWRTDKLLTSLAIFHTASWAYFLCVSVSASLQYSLTQASFELACIKDKLSMCKCPCQN